MLSAKNTTVRNIVLFWLVFATMWMEGLPLCSPQEIVGEMFISLSRSWAHRWINHWSLWCVARVTPDLRLPSQPQGITALWPVPTYTAWWQRHMCEQLAQGCYLKVDRLGVEPGTFCVASQHPNHYTTMPLCNKKTVQVKIWKIDILNKVLVTSTWLHSAVLTLAVCDTWATVGLLLITALAFW